MVDGGIDVLVPLSSPDSNMWKCARAEQVELMCVPITDFKALPQNILVKYANRIADLLRDGKVVGMHCVGGHGRTGYMASAVVGLLLPDIENPIEYIRTNYCEKAVESEEQITSLALLFPDKPKIKETKVSKVYTVYNWKETNWSWQNKDTCMYCKFWSFKLDGCIKYLTDTHRRTSDPTCKLFVDYQDKADVTCGGCYNFVEESYFGKSTSGEEIYEGYCDLHSDKLIGLIVSVTSDEIGCASHPDRETSATTTKEKDTIVPNPTNDAKVQCFNCTWWTTYSWCDLLGCQTYVDYTCEKFEPNTL